MNTFRQTALLRARLSEYKKRLEQSRAIIKKALAESHRPYIAYSTGKDSTVMAHLVWEQAPDIPGVYFDANCAFPESVALIDREEQQHKIIKVPVEPLLETLKRYGGPLADDIGYRTMVSTVYQPLKRLRSEYNFNLSFVGLRAEESNDRKMLIASRGLLFMRADGIAECLPVGWWQYWDVWAYILSNNIDYNHAYDKMLDMPVQDRRISYWAGETKGRWGRYVFLKRHYLPLYQKLCELFPEVRGLS